MLLRCSRLLWGGTYTLFVLATSDARDIKLYWYLESKRFFFGLDLPCCVTAPVTPTLLSYIIGLIFYVTQFPECILLDNVCQRLDTIGIGKNFSLLSLY